MQPHYLGELSKTSRTLAAEDVDQYNTRINDSIGPGSTVIRRVPKVHKRNKKKIIPYYERKHKIGQRVSLFEVSIRHFTNIFVNLIANYLKAMVPTNGSLAFSSYQDSRINQKILIQEKTRDRHVDPILPPKKIAVRKKVTANSSFLLGSATSKQYVVCISSITDAVQSDFTINFKN